MKPLVSIVIPVFNRWKLTEACLRSVRATTARAQVQVIVVDNGSTDETAEQCQAGGLVDTYVPVPTNQGFAWGCNYGLLEAEADAVVFLNNDTVALDGWLPPTLENLRDPTIGAVGALLWYPGRVRAVQHAGMAFSTGPKVLHLYRHRREEHEPGIMRAKDLQCVTGAFLAMRRSEARALGGFCTEYRNGFEDVDLCFRVRFQLGLRVRYEPRIQLLHHESQTEGRGVHEAENELLFFSKWGDKVAVDLGGIMRQERAAAAD